MVVVPKSLGMVKDRWFVRIAGISDEVVIKPFNHTISALKRAVTERVFFVKENGKFVRPPKPLNFSARLERVRFLLVPLLPKTTPWSTNEFVDSCKGAKKRRYEDARESLLQKPLSREDSKVEVFVKREKTDFTSKADPVPRVISPRSPRYNLMIGKYLKKIEHRIFKSIRKLFGSHTVMKGFNAYVSAKILRQKWERFSEPVAIGLDASRFDQHVSVDALKWEHEIYLECFYNRKHRTKLAKLLQCQLHNHCTGYAPDGFIRYDVEGTRMSGDMNTSLGNCVLMCSMIYAYALEKNIKLELANNGDDCVVIMEKSDEEAFGAGLFDWFYEMGFNMKIEEPVYDFGKIEFCQTMPVFDGNRWLMVRKPSAVLSKDTVMLEPYQSKKQLANWMFAVGMGGLRLTGGLPVLQNFYRAFLKYGKPNQKPREYSSWYQSQMMKNMDRDFGAVTPEARDSFFTSFGITPDEQIELENYFDSWTFKFEKLESCHEDFEFRDFPL
jgi:hypothetical protein